MAPDPRPGCSLSNPINVDDLDDVDAVDHGAAGREASPEMTAFPLMPEEPPHGLPLDVFPDDDQDTVATEVATSPPTLTDVVAEGNFHGQPPDIEGGQEQETTDSSIHPDSINAAIIHGDCRSRGSSVGIPQGNDPVHPVHSFPPNEVQESAGIPRPATSNYSGCNASGSAAVESSDALSIFHTFASRFCPTWKIIEGYPDRSGYLDVRLRIPYAGPRKRSAAEPEPAADGGTGENSGPGEGSGPQLRRSKRTKMPKHQS
ncbi:hypothetical protein Asppvi_003789 [Aspergillus pseudoviridinutans]|uniref:Uncharacterized protein n=1 Tax=Aspergillus pseudoviridinutans TaxID=1517512 RepID=A0A9P3B7N8_9EURO|nr:uncharacterized protein Asppvi_003789 [Aspergillus pseudoviridinutans]GIJ84934.1 hypothetical protein Asppvi_003789 [Aspergillus pseudoviridinutans]